MPRARTGQLLWRGSSWSARYTDADGKRHQVALDTDNAALAKQKLKQLVEGAAPVEVTAQGVETFAAAVARVVGSDEVDRNRRLKRWALPQLGPLSCDRVGKAHVRAVLKAAIKDGYPKGTVVKLKCDISRVLQDLVDDDTLKVNAARGFTMPEMREDKRRRAQPTDAEFSAFTAHCADEELRTAAVLARCVGGLRTSDLGELRVRDYDGATLTVRRTKTQTEDVHALTPEVVAVVQEWLATRKPELGPNDPLFPVPGTRRRRARRGFSFAARFRAALLAAGCDRHELHHDTDTTRKCDFHSLRRAYATALARAGVNQQQAKRLAAHLNDATHARYVQLADVLVTPAAALPVVKAHTAPFHLPDGSATSGITTTPDASVSGISRRSDYSIDTNTAANQHAAYALPVPAPPYRHQLVPFHAADAALQAYLKATADALASAVVTSPFGSPLAAPQRSVNQKADLPIRSSFSSDMPSLLR